ncbi:MAG: hypothetical protein ACREMY_05410, partial [bacterium]
MWHRVLAPGDGVIYYLPMHRLVAEALRSGQMPVWNPFQFSGSPLLATAQPAPFYPLEAFFLAFPASVANNLYVVCNYSIAALGTFFLVRRLVRDAAGGCVAALVFVSSGFMYGQISHQSVVAAVAWLPWALHGLERLREKVDSARVIGLAVPLAASFLAGQPQMSFLVVLVLVLCGAVQLMLAEPRLRKRLTRCAWTLGALTAVEVVAPQTVAVEEPALAVWIVVLALLVFAFLRLFLRRRPRVAYAALLALVAGATSAAAQLLPVMRIVDETSRARLSYSDATSFSFPGSHVILMLFPRLFGASGSYRGQFNLLDLSGYPGAAALVLAAVGFARARNDARFVALAAVAGVAFVAALGRTTAFGFLVWSTPILGQFRSWGRYAVVLDLAVAVCAGYGVATIREDVDRRAVVRGARVAGLVVAVGLFVPVLPSVAGYSVSGWERAVALVPPMCAALAALGCIALFRRRLAFAVTACAVIIVADGVVS